MPQETTRVAVVRTGATGGVGCVCDNGKEHQVPTPLNAAITTMIKEIEAGKRAVDPQNVNDPLLKNLIP